jgi:1,4-alpha-glucan branching enzyme
LNGVYRRTPPLYERDFDADGFEWVDNRDWENSLISFLRKGRDRDDALLVVCNFTPQPRTQYRVGVPRAGFWREVLNSDAREYGGSGLGSLGGAKSEAIPANNRAHSVSLTIPPLAIVYFRCET